MIVKKYLFKYPRHWYHLSNKLKNNIVHLIPNDNDSGRSMEEPPGARICVAPTIEQCLVAIPYLEHGTYNIYRTQKKVIPRKPPINTVFDWRLTNEGWLETPTTFVKYGIFNIEKFSEYLTEQLDTSIISEAASQGCFEYCREVLRWWQKNKIYKKYIVRLDK